MAGSLAAGMRRKGPLTWAYIFQHLSASDSVRGRHVPQVCPADDPTDEELIEFLILCPRVVLVPTQQCCDQQSCSARPSRRHLSHRVDRARIRWVTYGVDLAARA